MFTFIDIINDWYQFMQIYVHLYELSMTMRFERLLLNGFKADEDWLRKGEMYWNDLWVQLLILDLRRFPNYIRNIPKLWFNENSKIYISLLSLITFYASLHLVLFLHFTGSRLIFSWDKKSSHWMPNL